MTRLTRPMLNTAYAGTWSPPCAVCSPPSPKSSAFPLNEPWTSSKPGVSRRPFPGWPWLRHHLPFTSCGTRSGEPKAGSLANKAAGRNPRPK